MSVDHCNNKILKSLRKKLGMTQQQFADALKIKRRQTISEWENQKYEPTFTLEQSKALDALLSTLELRLKDLPEDLIL